MIIFAHLLNDSSGSPRVLRTAIAALARNCERTKLYIGRDGDGCLSQCGIPITRYWYRRTTNRLLTLFTYLASQFLLFIHLLRDKTIDRDALIYVNTLLPFGAAFYGCITNKKIIYHVHEISITPALLRLFLIGIARWTSSLNIYVSNAHQKALPIPGVTARCIYNALDSSFAATARSWPYTARRDGRFNVLMVASLRDYKGVPEFVSLADALAGRSDVRFELLVNDDEAAVARYFSRTQRPANVTVHSNSSDTISFYRRASLVVNLSRVDQWVETFGMTILEAMAFGIPVIAPPVGGPLELVDEGVQGYLIDSRDQAGLRERILHLATDEQTCHRLSVACRERAATFSGARFAESINEVISHVRCNEH